MKGVGGHPEPRVERYDVGRFKRQVRNLAARVCKQDLLGEPNAQEGDTAGELRQRVVSFQKLVRERFDLIERRFDLTDQRFGRVDRKLDNIASQIEKLDIRVGAVETRLSSIEDIVNKIAFEKGIPGTTTSGICKTPSRRASAGA